MTAEVTVEAQIERLRVAARTLITVAGDLDEVSSGDGDTIDRFSDRLTLLAIDLDNEADILAAS